MAHAFFGDVDSESGRGWQSTTLVNGRSVALSMLAFEPPTDAQLDTLEGFVRDLDRLDARARNELAARISDDSSVGMYIEHHLAELSAPALQTAFGTADKTAITPATFLDRMLLRTANLWPSGPRAVLDYTLDGDVTQYVLAVTFAADASVTSVSMES